MREGEEEEKSWIGRGEDRGGAGREGKGKERGLYFYRGGRRGRRRKGGDGKKREREEKGSPWCP